MARQRVFSESWPLRKDAFAFQKQDSWWEEIPQRRRNRDWFKNICICWRWTLKDWARIGPIIGSRTRSQIHISSQHRRRERADLVPQSTKRGLSNQSRFRGNPENETRKFTQTRKLYCVKLARKYQILGPNWRFRRRSCPSSLNF